MSMITPLIAEDISRTYSGRKVVDAANLTLQPGKVTALIGQSGSGKTTLLRLLAGMERPDTGTIRSGDELLSGSGKHVPVDKRRIGLVFQDFALFPHLTVLSNVMFGLRKLPKADRITTAEHWLEQLGLSHRRDAYPHHLSGGEQQRTAIARALAPQPVAILLDEPFSGLDPAMRDQVRETALEAVRSAGIPALLVTHDASEALVHADTIAVINEGQILQTGTPETVYRDPTNAKVASALGPIHRINLSALPEALRASLQTQADEICYRPEAVQIGTGHPLKVLQTRLAGPITEIALQVSDKDTLYAACQPGTPLTSGDTVNVTLNPDLVFDFTVKTI